RIFNASAPAKGTGANEAVPALDAAFTKTASELVAWSVDKLASAAPAPSGNGADNQGASDQDSGNNGGPLPDMPDMPAMPAMPKPPAAPKGK
ncbi:MAG TPA: hypothetical protein VE224_08100, partial [Pseudolabrys sp.]|nr:hypothetical protein [Pseudolabrys sp.]